MFKITEEELLSAKAFFEQKDIEKLTSQATKFNIAQPNFSAAVLALEMHGLDRIKVEELLESIFVIYYVHTELRRKKINQVSFGQIRKNAALFGEFIKYYTVEKHHGTDDLSQIKFLHDDIVLNFAEATLRDLFGDTTNIPKEVIIIYFALLKAIEIAAEK